MSGDARKSIQVAVPGWADRDSTSIDFVDANYHNPAGGTASSVDSLDSQRNERRGKNSSRSISGDRKHARYSGKIIISRVTLNVGNGCLNNGTRLRVPVSNLEKRLGSKKQAMIPLGWQLPIGGPIGHYNSNGSIKCIHALLEPRRIFSPLPGPFSRDWPRQGCRATKCTISILALTPFPLG